MAETTRKATRIHKARARHLCQNVLVALAALCKVGRVCTGKDPQGMNKWILWKQRDITIYNLELNSENLMESLTVLRCYERYFILNECVFVGLGILWFCWKQENDGWWRNWYTESVLTSKTVLSTRPLKLHWWGVRGTGPARGTRRELGKDVFHPPYWFLYKNREPMSRQNSRAKVCF